MNEHLFSRQHGCRVSDAFSYNGLRLVLFENELLQISILPEKGAEIASLRYKPSDVDPLLHTRQALPGRFPATIPSKDGAFIDAYQGGWQELFPSGGGPCTVNGAELGRHGEVALLPWQWEICQDEPQEVAVHFWVQTRRSPFRLDRTLRLSSGQSMFSLDEIVTNEGGRPAPFLWGHHPAFGSPFLEEGCRLDSPALHVSVHEGQWNPANRLVPGSHGEWPNMIDHQGQPVDLRFIPAVRGGFADMFYLTGFEQGWYALTNPRLGLGVAMVWPADVFSCLWVWQEFCGSTEWPWFGRATALGLEPCTGYSTSGPSGLGKVIEAGRERVLAPDGQLSAWLKTVIFPNPDNQVISRVSPDGEIIFA